MDRLKDCFTYDTEKEDYVKELQNTLDKLESLVNNADTEGCPIWEYLTEKTDDTLAYTVINLINAQLEKEQYSELNRIIFAMEYTGDEK